MSTDPLTMALLAGPCGYCGGYHVGTCPRVKAIEYHPNGMVARIEFFDGAVGVYCTEGQIDLGLEETP